MNEYNYNPKNKNKNKFNEKNPFSLTNLIKVNNHLYIKKVLKSLENDNNQKNNINYTQRNNSNSKDDIKRYIYFNNTEKKINIDNSNDLSNDSTNIFEKRLNKNFYNYTTEKNKNMNNSFSTILLYDKKYVLNNQSKLSDYILKPYKKKNIIINPKVNNNKERYKMQKIKLDLSSPDIYINDFSNSYTERSFNNKNKGNNTTLDNKFNIINIKKNIKNNKLSNKIYTKKEKIEIRKSLISILENDVVKYNETEIFKEKKKKSGKINTRKNNKTLKRSVTPDTLIIKNKYQNRLTKVLILLLEKFFKTYLLKYKYIFLKNLKNFLKDRRKKFYTRNKNIRTALNNYYQTEINKDTKKEKNLFLIKYPSRKERILMYQLKNENTNHSPDKTNSSELCRNLSELNRMKKIIERRKRSQSKNQEKSKEIEKERNEKKKTIKNIIYKNKNISRNNVNLIKKIKVGEKCDYDGKILIIKKIKTNDQKISIDIKSIDFFDFGKKKKFINLKISKSFSIDLIRNRNISPKNFVLKRLGYNFYNNKNYEKYNDKNSLGLIKEEEEKSYTDDRLHSRYSNEDIKYYK